ncbi:MAG: ATP-binding protein [Tannerella sp.]|nr:ATP-binding protein [Tannerella sp.]
MIWDNLYPDVNVLVGINGSGKSTLLNILDAVLASDEKALKEYKSDIRIHFEDGATVLYENGKLSYSGQQPLPLHTIINTFDVPVRNKSKLNKKESPLTLELKDLIYPTGTLEHDEGHNIIMIQSFNDYRLLASSDPAKVGETAQRINLLFDEINSFFSYTGKTIFPDSNKILFRLQDDKTVIQLEQLSAGEKQLLIILFKIFLLNDYPYIVLLDEPEISLHVEWQMKFIASLQKLNQNCQFLISTHSPGIFGQGWGTRLTFMEELFK